MFSRCCCFLSILIVLFSPLHQTLTPYPTFTPFTPTSTPSGPCALLARATASRARLDASPHGNGARTARRTARRGRTQSQRSSAHAAATARTEICVGGKIFVGRKICARPGQRDVAVRAVRVRQPAAVRAAGHSRARGDCGCRRTAAGTLMVRDKVDHINSEYVKRITEL